MENSSSSLTWEKVEKYLAEKTKSGYILALLETEKILQKILEKLKFPGKTTSQKIKGLKFILSDYSNFLAAHKLCEKIISELNFEPNQEEIEKSLKSYYQAIEEIANFQKEKQNIILRLKIKFATSLPSSPRKFFKKLILSLVVFFFIIFLLDSTKTGRALVYLLVKISHFIFTWLLLAILLLFLLATFIVGIIFYLEHRKKTRIIKIEN